MSNRLHRAHIFSVGTWNKQTFDEAALDLIAGAFNDLSQAGRVPLKFGHGESKDEQPFSEGHPALGWVSRVWREGTQLFADFIDMPTAVFNAVKQGLYKFVSIELLKNAERDGKKYPFVLDAIALLGADIPAVSNLQDLQSLALSRDSFKFAEALSFTRDFQSTLSGDDTTMDPKELQKAIADALAPMEARVNALSTELTGVKTERDTFKTKAEALQVNVTDMQKAADAEKVKMARESANAVLEAAVRERKILPALREKLKKMFKIDEDEAVLTLNIKDLEDVCSVTTEDAKKVLNSKSSFSRDPNENRDRNGDTPNTNDVVMEAVRAHADKTGKDVFASFAEVMRINPQLGRAFTEHNFEEAR